MKGYLLLFFTFLSVNIVFASTDFFRFDNGYNHIGGRNIYFNGLYPSHRIFTGENSSYSFNSPQNVFKTNRIKETDIEYLLSRMEKTKFGSSNDNLDIESRLDKLDSLIFGTIQPGDYNIRLNRLKQAFSAESTRNYKSRQRNLFDFKNFFSSGYPTSMPMPESYYSAIGEY